MADFQLTREKLNKGRDDRETARLDVTASTHRLRSLEQRRRELERQKGDDNEAFAHAAEDLDQKIASEKQVLARHREKYSGLIESLSELELEFERFVDPRRELGQHFSNNTPFLLFPLRLETRFKTVDDGKQLWVRVYPDECLVDSFEPLLSGKEVNNGARFWAEYYGAGTSADPEDPDPEVLNFQKAAWALLVSAAGDGRAAWITRRLKPDTTKSVFPLRGDKTVILAIATDEWDSTQQGAIFDLLSKLWFANGNAQLIDQIKTDFNNANPGMDADQIFEKYRPVNFDEKLPLEIKKREDAILKIAVAVFNDLKNVAGKEHGWSQATRVNLMPERLALIRFKGGAAMDPIFGRTIPHPLPTSPDPSKDAEKQFEQTTEGDLEFAESIKWVADFDRAVEIGMGFRVDLAADEAEGFERLMVLGVRLGSDSKTGKQQLEELFDHHYFSKKGFTLVTQGTPTNNTGAAGSGYTGSDDPDQTFDLYFNGKDGYSETTDPLLKRDGQWFAEWLGLDHSTVKKVLHSDKRDQADARNMNTALWPATMGYVLESMMEGGFSGETLLHTRNFFNDHVSGRGAVPAIRIGNQPYGILPTAAFDRLKWMNVGQDDHHISVLNTGYARFIKNLYELLLKMDAYWAVHMLGKVPFVSKPTTSPYQDLLDIIVRNANSVEFHRRYLESLIELTNKMSIIKPGFKANQNVVIDALKLLHDTLGYQTDILPQIAALLGVSWEVPVKHLIDDRPLSEENDIRDYTADKKNYIEALIDQAKKGENAVRIGEGLTQRPSAELYRLLKYALELGYHKSAVDAAEEKQVFAAHAVASMRKEHAFVHQPFKEDVVESRYAILYDTLPAVSPDKPMWQVVRDSLTAAEVPFFSKYLASQIKALENLKDASTARLERAFVEHLDCCSYRLDAWKASIVTSGLSTMRNNQPGDHFDRRRTGIYIGAFGWLENVRPEKNKVLTPKSIPEDLVEDFNRDGKKQFVTDAANEGYIHAPSLNQAVTAAVLRNGFVSHGKPDATNVLAVDLTSERIRLALSVIEGIQGGQSLAALLGYHFERKLHNRQDLTSKKIDSYIYAIRKLFPLNADKLKETRHLDNSDPSVDPETVPITAIEARNVVHGVKLAEHVKKQTSAAKKRYPFGLALPFADSVITTAITETVAELINIADAVADLGMAESVHQVVMGNYDRAAGVLESYTKGNYPQEPDVIRTPRSGPTLTHRVSVPFAYVAVDPDAGASPRAQGEPSVNAWLSNILPPLDKIVCQCSFTSRADGLSKTEEVSLNQIGLEHIDLLYMLNAADTNALDELDDRIIFLLKMNFDPVLEGDFVINYIEEPATADRFSVFQVMPLVKSLRVLITESAALTPGDIALPNEADKKEMPAPELDPTRANNILTQLKADLKSATDPGGVVDDLRNLPGLESLTDVQRAAALETIRQNADDILDRFSAFLITLATYGIQQTSIGPLHSARQQWYMELKKKVEVFADRWKQKSDQYDELEALPPTTEEELLSMERLISTSTTAGVTLADVQAKHALFINAFNDLKLVLDTHYETVFGLIDDIRVIDTAPFDTDLLDISDELRQIPLFIYDLQARANSLVDDLENTKIPAAETIQTSLPGLSLEDQAKQTEAAVQIVLGEQFAMFPRYSMPAALQAEVGNSWNDTASLLNHLSATRLDPLEDWLHGMARVHEKMKHLENCIVLRDAFELNGDDFAIHPVQLPYKTEKYHWMAMPFPVDEVDMEEGNTLLYTAFTDAGAASPNEVCGALVDEWTEVIPTTEEVTGITFHYDRPNCEAPQALLLVVPTTFTGNWNWNDLVDAVTYTFRAAKSRFVGPTEIDSTPFTTFLPAIIGAESLFPYSIVLDNEAHYKAII
ncbi:MAG TPA: hypothetical protein VFZ23_04320 [Pyrinomonadaceae bacterium]